jgi:hypothetical protein
MGGQRNNTDVVSAERKQHMRENYEAKRDIFNRNKIIRELDLNKRLFVKQATIDKYTWTIAQLTIIHKHNTLYKEERTKARPVIREPTPIVVRNNQEPELPPPPTVTDRTYTKEMAIQFLESRIESRNIKESTVTAQIRKITPLLKLFNVKNTNLMEIYDKYDVKDIKAKILSNKRWKANSTLKAWVGFGGLLAYDPRFKNIVGREKAILLQRDYKNIRDDSNEEQRAKQATTDENYRAVYFGMFDKAKEGVYDKGTLQHALTMLYTHGMYPQFKAWKEKDKIVVVPRNYFHEVLMIDNESLADEDTRRNFYIPTTGRMILNGFKTGDNFPFDYVLPKEVKDTVNAYIRNNKNTTYLIEKENGGKYAATSLGTVVKRTLGYNIAKMRKAVENYEVLGKNSDRELVAVAMGHTKRTQEQQYLQTIHYEDKDKYVGRKVSVQITDGANEGKLITGVVALNNGTNDDYPADEMPYAIVFDKRFKEPDEFVSFPDDDIKFLDEAPITTSKSKNPKPKAPTKKTTTKKTPDKTTSRKSTRNKRR